MPIEQLKVGQFAFPLSDSKKSWADMAMEVEVSIGSAPARLCSKPFSSNTDVSIGNLVSPCVLDNDSELQKGVPTAGLDTVITSPAYLSGTSSVMNETDGALRVVMAENGVAPGAMPRQMAGVSRAAAVEMNVGGPSVADYLASPCAYGQGSPTVPSRVEVISFGGVSV
jgi:hypothetical protein